MTSRLRRALSIAVCAALPLALAAPAQAALPKPGAGGGKSKTVKSSCSWSPAVDQTRFGQAYVSVKFQGDRTGAIFPVAWTLRDDSVGWPSGEIRISGTVARADGTVALFSGTTGVRGTLTGSPAAVRLLPGEKISYRIDAVDLDVWLDPSLPSCTGTIKVPRTVKR